MFFAPGDKSEELVNFIGYCLACAANEYGIKVHACVVMSNHHHTDVTDPHGKLPAFVQRFHSLLARGMNKLRGRTGTFWDGEKPCQTIRPADDETLQDLVYTLTNPVKDGLVESSRQWPGFTTRGWKFGKARIFRRPPWFFDKKGEMPDVVSLTLARPAVFVELDDDALYKRLEEEIKQDEREHQRELRKQGKDFVGPDTLARRSWKHLPKQRGEQFKVTPKVASSCKRLRLTQLQQNREWEREYAAARELFRAGRPAIFPYGTYWLKHHAGVDVAEQTPS